MRKFAVPAMLAALAAVQLIRIERVAAGDPAETPLAALEEVTRFTDEGSVTISAEADAEARLAEFKEIAERPYVIEPPDVLTVQFDVKVDASELLGGEPGTQALIQAKPKAVLVAMDGKINLGEITVFVAGCTLDEARDAIEQRLQGRYDEAHATVEVASYNSKVCYVIDQRGKFGDVARLPVPHPMTADFNVGAALAQTESREFDLADARIWIARPAANGVGSELVLPVAWDAATEAPAPETNHPLLPGDRVFVEAPKSAGPRTIGPHDQLAVTFQRADGARLDLVDPKVLNSTPGVIVSPSADSITFQVPVDDKGSADFQVWFNSGAIEIAGKTFREAGQVIHDGVLGTQDQDYVVAVEPAVTWPAAPPKLAAAPTPASEALPEQLPPEFPASAARSPKPLPQAAPSLPTTTAKDPGTDAVVTLVFKLAKDREVKQFIAIDGPTTLGDLLASTTYPEPIDFAAAMITLTRPFGPRALDGQTEVAVGWDRAAQRPVPESDYGLEDGDTVTIDLVGPPTGAKVHPEPVFSFSLGFSRNDGLRRGAPTAAPAVTPNPAPDAVPPTAAEPARQLEFQFQFVDDASGALADFELPVSGGGMSVGDSREVLSALRVFKKHKLIATVAYPVIRTEEGRPASFNMAEPVKPNRDGSADFRVVRAVTVLAHAQNRYGANDDLLVKVQARAGGSEVDMGVAMQIGQTAIVQIPPADGDDDLPAHYIVITPRWVE